MFLNFSAVFAILTGKETISATHCFQNFNNNSSKTSRLTSGTAILFNSKREYKYKVTDPETIQAKATIFTDIVYLKADQRMEGIKKLELRNINEKHYEYGSYDYKFLNLTTLGYDHDGKGYTRNSGLLKQVSSILLGIDPSIGVFTASEGESICVAYSGGPLFNQLGEIVAVLNSGFGSYVHGSAATRTPYEVMLDLNRISVNKLYIIY
ncbi:hypothetical protein CONCODRAFT_3441 [Conidiobolus coronatus NRRL 28638]|uniref:Peptidase S1 domain-containing protein n=1 Tax=Conidiobolus coronatus (strain ATCC 28846 / CBS 209.66 / NRRL 28638) TaxID=796925 RepID=A0A137PF68_CONC2|nr:hypothetical protein CONCODRAFT_3441 [Conidiobolus coronatus NRRL 28638]|eukprot:KXN73622.1 hypothetical protein CONCODRAFT_3441 [Conidiobolus coronatus NRRL 28638]